MHILRNEIVVEIPSFASYRFISFEIVTLEENRAKIVYTWYDDENSTQDDIEKNLKKSVDYFVNIRKSTL